MLRCVIAAEGCKSGNLLFKHIYWRQNYEGIVTSVVSMEQCGPHSPLTKVPNLSLGHKSI